GLNCVRVVAKLFNHDTLTYERFYRQQVAPIYLPLVWCHKQLFKTIELGLRSKGSPLIQKGSGKKKTPYVQSFNPLSREVMYAFSSEMIVEPYTQKPKRPSDDRKSFKFGQDASLS